MAITVVLGLGKSAEDYVASLEALAARDTDVNWHVGVKSRAAVAQQVIDDEHDAKNITYRQWQELSRRVGAVQEKLIDADLW